MDTDNYTVWDPIALRRSLFEDMIPEYFEARSQYIFWHRGTHQFMHGNESDFGNQWEMWRKKGLRDTIHQITVQYGDQAFEVRCHVWTLADRDAHWHEIDPLSMALGHYWAGIVYGQMRRAE